MNKISKNIKVIAFDADDTLWVNETYFRDAEHQFAKLLAQYETENKIDQELFKTEIKNLTHYGYGVKGFVLSMIECALELSNYQVNQKTIEAILTIGKEMLEKPIELLDGIEEVLHSLQGKYKLIVATKGDLLDQERKLEKSNLLKYFHHIEVMSDKKRERLSKIDSTFRYSSIRTFNDWKFFKVRCFTFNRNRSVCNSRSVSYNLGS